jgi:hypothetical protein
LLTGSGDDLCGLLPAVFQTAAYHLPTVGLSAFLAICLLIVFVEISSLLPPFPGALSEFLPHLLCASFQLLIYCSGFFFYRRGICPGGYAGLLQQWLGENCMALGALLFGLLNVSQAGLEPVAGGDDNPPVFTV